MNSNKKKLVFSISLFFVVYLVGYICYLRDPSSTRRIKFKYPPRRKSTTTSPNQTITDSTQNPNLLNKTNQENINHKSGEVGRNTTTTPFQLQTSIKVKENVEDLPEEPTTKVEENIEDLPEEPTTKVEENVVDLPEEPTTKVEENVVDLPEEPTTKVEENVVDLPEEPTTKGKENVESQMPKTILYWYRPWGERRNSQLGEECGKCTITDDRAKIDSPSTAAVVFHFNELSRNTMPTKRNEEQYYIYNKMESPAYVLRVNGDDLHQYDNVFNWTMTYRRDSDIFSPYFTMSTIMEQIKNKFKDTNDVGVSWIMKQKKRLAVWVVTNCGYTNGAKNRMKLVEEMVQAGIDVDRRGRCFPDNPPPPGSRTERSKQKHKDFMTSAKFNIAFENSHHCKDYITEKLFVNSYLYGAVPIVWGATKEDYEDFVPPHSCIYMDDFGGNLTKLADYIKYLDQNDTAYEEYFSWRKMGVEEMFGFGRTFSTCLLCQMISTSPPLKDNAQITNSTTFPTRRKTIKSLKSWVYDNEEAECLK